MTDYSKMSDYEISCEVGRAISFGDYLLARNEQKNYCNSWADAGPIIASNSISLVNWEGSAWIATEKAYWVDGIEWHIDGVEHENPLRAAMIVFLMMNEEE